MNTSGCYGVAMEMDCTERSICYMTYSSNGSCAWTLSPGSSKTNGKHLTHRYGQLRTHTHTLIKGSQKLSQLVMSRITASRPLREIRPRLESTVGGAGSAQQNVY